jgi:hypothetical protein
MSFRIKDKIIDVQNGVFPFQIFNGELFVSFDVVVVGLLLFLFLLLPSASPGVPESLV